jgi:hypothetical protein
MLSTRHISERTIITAVLLAVGACSGDDGGKSSSSTGGTGGSGGGMMAVPTSGVTKGGSSAPPTTETAKTPKNAPSTSSPGATMEATGCEDASLDGYGTCGDDTSMYFCSGGDLWRLDCDAYVRSEGWEAGTCIETDEIVACLGCGTADDGVVWCCTGEEPGDICCSEHEECVLLEEETGGADSCEYANDGECDEPDYCEYGTDTTDCLSVEF